MQGPFTNMEMSEWFKAGYFGQDLKVRRHCDERFYLLGELIAMCNSNPFQTRCGLSNLVISRLWSYPSTFSVQFPVLKNDISKMPEHDRQFQMLPQIEAYKQAQARVMADPWSALALRQHELVSQRLILQQQVTENLCFYNNLQHNCLIVASSTRHAVRTTTPSHQSFHTYDKSNAATGECV